MVQAIIGITFVVVIHAVLIYRIGRMIGRNEILKKIENEKTNGIE